MTQRRSDKVSPLLDDQEKHEIEPLLRGAPVEARDEFRMQEPPGDDDPEPNPGHRPDDEQPMGLAPPQQDVEARSELARHLRPSVFPARRDDLLTSAEEEMAPPAVLADLRRLPPDRTYENVQQVWAAIGGATEETHTGHRQDD